MLAIETNDRIDTCEISDEAEAECLCAKETPKSPDSLRLVIALAASIFIAESPIMLMLSFIPPIPTHFVMFVDSIFC